jgi:CMP/dCMP kinase
LTKKYVVTVDGPAGSGKSTVGRLLAQKLSYVYLDTGALYRAMALKVRNASLSPGNREKVAVLCRATTIALRECDGATRILLDGEDVTELIRTPEISMLASTISALPEVRGALLSVQRDSARDGGVVAEGRDMGTVVFPGADVKFFLTASAGERSRRRWMELKDRGHEVSLDEVLRDVVQRDRQDSERELAPLRPADDGVLVDSTGKNIDEVVEEMLGAVRRRSSKAL